MASQMSYTVFLVYSSPIHYIPLSKGSLTCFFLLCHINLYLLAIPVRQQQIYSHIKLPT
ncbi:hypothetical protein H8356DRAFT_1429230 [Neocallimastix lanati (nom. inval.)]|nr:hypothetical protein H8356DRAFT_1429230 [Neocallimastix sp. JGI-2020a]